MREQKRNRNPTFLKRIHRINSTGMISRHCFCRMLCIILAVPMVLCDFEVQRMQKDLMSPDKFGPITGKLLNMTICKAPKRRNCTEIRITPSDHVGYKNTTFTVNFLRPTPLTKTKISMWRLKTDSLTIPDISKIVAKPCNHFFIAPLLKKYLKISGGARCIVSKGLYISHVNCEQMIYEMMGFQFFYGTYRSETHIFSDDCTVFCMHTDFLLMPKVGDKSKKTKSHQP